MRIIAPEPKKTYGFLYLKEVNKRWLKNQKKTTGLSMSAFVDQVIDQLRNQALRPKRKKLTRMKRRAA